MLWRSFFWGFVSNCKREFNKLEKQFKMHKQNMYKKLNKKKITQKQ